MSDAITTAVTQQLQGLIDPYTGDKMTAAKGLRSIDVADDKVTGIGVDETLQLLGNRGCNRV